MIRAYFLVLLFLAGWQKTLVSQQLQPIGQWTDHLPYHSAINISSYGPSVTAATPYSIFSIDREENSVWRKSKLSGLTSTGIVTMAQDPVNGTIIIAYNDATLDIVKEEKVYGIDDIKNSNIFPSPVIHSIYFNNSIAYICTSYGISVINTSQHVISETYIIGSQGAKIDVYAVTVAGEKIFVATSEGLKAAFLNGSNLQDYRSWSNLMGPPGIAPNGTRHLTTFKNHLLINAQDSVFLYDEINWKNIYHSQGRINDLSAAGNTIMIAERLNSSNGRIIQLDEQGNILSPIQDDYYTAYPMQALTIDEETWIADSLAGLSRFDGTSFTGYAPTSPAGIGNGQLFYSNGTTWIAHGSVTSNYQPQHIEGSISWFQERNWKNYTGQQFHLLNNVEDIISITYNDQASTTWAGSFGDGLLELNGNEITQYKQGSFIAPSAFSPNEYLVSGLYLDQDKNLWISNYGADENIIVRKPSGDILKFRPPFALPGNAVAGVLLDDMHQAWIISPGNGIIIFNYGSDLDNKNDDQWKLFKTGAGAGNLPSNEVLSMVKDMNGFIWIGTSSGIGIVQCPDQVFSPQPCETIIPIVQQGNFAGYLFRGEAVQAIAVDGANRKWVGTKNGVWLISEDGEKVIERFNAANSPLPGDDVRNISIDRQTGEVFFATTNGICSYRGTATGIENIRSKVMVYPNPVPPGYGGTIAIKGLPANAVFKITELDGRLVYQSRTLGEQAIWNGRDYKGRKVSAGIYLVFSRANDGSETLVTKIAFIQ